MKAKWAASAFDGEGARLFGGRWNSKGVRMVYAAESLSLAALEILVNAPPTLLRTPWVAVSAELPEDVIATLDPSTLPPDWSANPAPQEVQRRGDRWAQDRSSTVLAVPSAVITSETNYLINPAHPDYARIHVSSAFVPFAFDQRLGTAP